MLAAISARRDSEREFFQLFKLYNYMVFRYLLLQVDPNFGQDVLEAAQGGALLVAESFDELWNETINGGLYRSLCIVGFAFALAMLALFMVQFARNWMNDDYQPALASYLWPIIVIGLLFGNGYLLANGTLALRNYMNHIDQIMLGNAARGADLDVAFSRAMGDIQLRRMVGNAIQRCNERGGTPQQVNDCLVQAREELEAYAPQLFPQEQNANENDWFFRSLSAIGAAIALTNPLAGAVDGATGGNLANTVGNFAMETVGSAMTGLSATWLLAINNAYQWGVEICWIIVALLAPMAVGASLTPYGQKPIVAWLAGFFAVGMAKFCFHIMLGLCAQLISTAQANQPMIFLLFISIVSPLLASAMAAGGGMAVLNALTKGVEWVASGAMTAGTAGVTSGAKIATAAAASRFGRRS